MKTGNRYTGEILSLKRNWKKVSITKKQGNIGQNHMKFPLTPKSVTINKQAKDTSKSRAQGESLRHTVYENLH